jgi:hypothetical protein
MEKFKEEILKQNPNIIVEFAECNKEIII